MYKAISMDVLTQAEICQLHRTWTWPRWETPNAFTILSTSLTDRPWYLAVQHILVASMHWWLHATKAGPLIIRYNHNWSVAWTGPNSGSWSTTLLSSLKPGHKQDMLAASMVAGLLVQLASPPNYTSRKIVVAICIWQHLMRMDPSDLRFHWQGQHLWARLVI